MATVFVLHAMSLHPSITSKFLHERRLHDHRCVKYQTSKCASGSGTRLLSHDAGRYRAGNLQRQPELIVHFESHEIVAVIVMKYNA